MAKKISKNNLKTLRNKIDIIDRNIYKLIQKRASHAIDIGKIKSKVSPGSSYYKPDRETKILRNIIKANEKGFQIYMLYLIQRDDCKEFRIAKDIDPQYNELLIKAARKNL